MGAGEIHDMDLRGRLSEIIGCHNFDMAHRTTVDWIYKKVICSCQMYCKLIDSCFNFIPAFLSLVKFSFNFIVIVLVFYFLLTIENQSKSS